MATRKLIPTWDVTSGAVDGSVQEAQAVPEDLQTYLDNEETLSNTTGRMTLKHYEYFADIGGAGTVSRSWTAPFDCEIVSVGGYKPAGAGGANEKVELKTGSNVISTWALSGVTAPAQIQGTVVYTYRQVSAGDVLTILQTDDAGANDSSAYVWFEYIAQ